MQRIYFSALTATAALVISLAPAAAQEFNAKDYDFNGNGRIDRGLEAEVFLKHRENPTFRKYDRNKNGKIEAAELSQMNQDADENVEILLIDFAGLDRDGRGVPIEKVQQQFVPSKPKGLGLPFLLRNAYTPFSITRPPTAAEAGPGTTLSYTQNRHTDTETIALKGAAFLYRQVELNTEYLGDIDTLRPTAISFAPGIEFDRTWSNRNPDRQPNYLGFRAMTELEVQGGIYDSQYFRVAPYYKTDFDFRSSVYGGEAQWFPVRLEYALGAAKKIPGMPVQVRWQPVAHIEYERVDNSGGFSNLMTGSEFGRGGGYIDTNLWIIDGPLNGLSFHAQYWHLWGLTGKDANRRYFETDIMYRLDPGGFAALTAKYRRGQAPGNGVYVNEFLAGVTIKN